MLDKHIEVMAWSRWSGSASPDEPDSWVVECPQTLNDASGIRRAKRDEAKRRNRQRLKDDVVDVLVTETVSDDKQHTLISDGAVLEFSEKV